ncbi:MAG TPA: STAS domain-containing protein [Gemmatimonadales bacterium]|nr:STAS domain-containing protein [Gemmatimonadales bacterium]
MNIATTLEGDTGARVRLSGRLDGEAAGQLADSLERLLKDGRRSVLLDMSGVTYLSSPGTLALQQAQQEWAAVRGDLRVTDPSPAAREALASAELLPRLTDPTAGDGQPVPPLPFEHSRDDWRVPTAVGSRGTYQVTTRLPGSELGCRVYGRPESALRGWIQPADYHEVEFPETSFGLGLGALGTSGAEAAARLGELVAADGAVAHLPTQGAQVPDFDVGLGGRAPKALLVSGFVCRGRFSLLTRFSSASEAEPVPLSEIARVALAGVAGQTAGIVLVAETTGLVGAWLRRSPGVEPTSIHLHLQGVRDWLGTTPQPIHQGATTIVAGIVSRTPDPLLAPFLRPLAGGDDLFAHFHAVVFTYRPVPQRTVALRPLVTRLYAQQPVRGVLHLIGDDRGAAGAGQSTFRRGLCWSGPVARVAAA